MTALEGERGNGLVWRMKKVEQTYFWKIHPCQTRAVWLSATNLLDERGVAGSRDCDWACMSIAEQHGLRHTRSRAMDQTFGPNRRADVCKNDCPLQTYICVSLNEEGTMEVGLFECVQAGRNGWGSRWTWSVRSFSRLTHRSKVVDAAATCECS